MRREKLYTGLLTVLVMTVTFVLCYFQPLYTVDRMLTDWLYQRPAGASPDIRIIAIDEKTLEALGPFNTWDRSISARLVEKLCEDPQAAPAVISMDILYISGADEEGDRRFAEACEKAGNVITAANLVYGKAVLEDGGEQYVDTDYIGMVEKPYSSLESVSGYGFANTVQDRDGYIRQAMAYAQTEEGTVYSLAWQTYSRYMQYLGEEPQMPELYANHRFDFRYAGRSGAYETVSMTDVLEGRVDVRSFKDCIVMVGAYAPGMQDAFNVAVQRGEQMYGVEIHANIVDALLHGRTALPAPEPLTSAVMALLSGAFLLLIRRIKVLAGAALLLAVTAAQLALGVWFSSHGRIFHLISLPLVLVAVYAVHIIWNYIQERKRRQEVVNAFKKYVAPQIVEKVSKDGEFKLVLGGESRHIAVMFVDIRGFTSMSETIRPEEVVEILNEYLDLTTRSILKNGGTLDKFIGDETMAVWNAPSDLDDYVYRAVCTARDIADGADGLERKLMDRFGRKISFGIGVHCGPAVVGNIGCDFRMDYTAIGDTVNTASRLEGKAQSGQILISDAVYEAVKDRVQAEKIGVIPLKGKSQGILVYSLKEVAGRKA